MGRDQILVSGASMGDEMILRALEAIERGEKLIQATTMLPAEQGFVNVTEVPHIESLEPECLAISITEKDDLSLNCQKE